MDLIESNGCINGTLYKCKCGSNIQYKINGVIRHFNTIKHKRFKSVKTKGRTILPQDIQNIILEYCYIGGECYSDILMYINWLTFSGRVLKSNNEKEGNRMLKQLLKITIEFNKINEVGYRTKSLSYSKKDFYHNLTKTPKRINRCLNLMVGYLITKKQLMRLYKLFQGLERYVGYMRNNHIRLNLADD